MTNFTVKLSEETISPNHKALMKIKKFHSVFPCPHHTLMALIGYYPKFISRIYILVFMLRNWHKVKKFHSVFPCPHHTLMALGMVAAARF